MPNRLVVFVHGWGAGAEDWWGTTGKSLSSHPQAGSTHFYFHRFLTTKSVKPRFWTMFAPLVGLDVAHERIGELGQTLWSTLNYEVTAHGCDEVVLFGHSFGGIVIADTIRHALKRESQGVEEDKRLLSRIRQIALCASPIDGARLAETYLSVAAPFGTNPHVVNLLNNNRERQDAVNVFVNFLQRPTAPSLMLFYATADQVVQRSEAFEPFNRARIQYNELALEGTHSECIQNVGPTSPNNANYQRLAAWLFPPVAPAPAEQPTPPAPTRAEAVRLRQSFDRLMMGLEQSINDDPFASWKDLRKQSAVKGTYLLRIFLQQLIFAASRINSHALGSANLWVAHRAGGALHLRSEEREGYFATEQLLSTSANNIDFRANRVIETSQLFERNSAGARAYLRGEPVLVVMRQSIFPSQQDESTGVTHVLGVPLCKKEMFDRFDSGQHEGVPLAITVDFLFDAQPTEEQEKELLRAGQQVTKLFRAFFEDWPRDEARLPA